MSAQATSENPLVSGSTATLESLFADWTFVQVDDSNGRHYPAPAGYYLFCGLPGSLGKDLSLIHISEPTRPY